MAYYSGKRIQGMYDGKDVCRHALTERRSVMRYSDGFTGKAILALKEAVCAAEEMGHTYIGSEHLLLGILEEGENAAAAILAKINASGVGPQGLGGDITSFAVHIEQFPCHIASLPVAVNLNCHAARHAGFEL